MGYLSQKKKANREAWFLKISAWSITIYTFFALFFDVALIRNILFHIYFFELLLLLYSMFTKRFLYVGIFALLAVTGYFQISSATPIFHNNKYKTAQTIEVIYDFAKIKTMKSENNIMEGNLILDEHKSFPFLQVLTDKDQTTIISVSLDEDSSETRSKEFKILENFIREQDSSVVLIGNFGVPAWSGEMRNFMDKTGLGVKNKLVFAKKNCRFCPLATPLFYVLSFSNVSVNRIEVSGSIPQIKVLLGFKNI